jgi:hypothetical protein
MKKFIESFGTNGSFFPICQNDFRPAMKQIGEKLAAKLGNPCISAPLVDVAPDTGIQADCQVVDQIPSGTSFTYKALPRCDRGTPPCWKLAADTSCTESGYKIDVDRAGVLAVPGTQQAIKCLTCASASDPRCMR